MTTTLVKPVGTGMNYTKFATPLALDPPAHCGLPTIYLGPGRHTLGTDPQCSIMLRAEGVNSRHVLILASEHRTVVKALDPRTWVNEGPVVETALRPGDRLSLGPLTFRVRAARNEELPLFVPAAETLDAALPRIEVPAPSSGKTEYRSDSRVDAGFRAETNAQMATDGLSTPSATRTHSSVASVVDIDSRPSSARPDVVSGVASPNPAAPNPTVAHQPKVDSRPDTKRDKSVAPASKPAEVSVVAVSVSEKLDSRLQEIQSTLAGLHQSAKGTPPLPPERLLQADSLSAERRRLELQQAELQRRADELAQRSKQLSDRMAHVVEREAEVERVRAQLAVENERLSTTSDATRRELSDEYARQMNLWQEWDAAYRRTSSELETQLKEANERRQSLVAETERIAVERSDAQREKAELERERRALAAEKVQLASDRSSLQTQRAQFDTERQQFTLTMQEREGQLMADRRALDHLQDELSLTRQHFERERTTFLGERAAEGQRREREIREHVELRRQLDDEEAALRADRRDTETLRRELDIERYAFDTIRSELESDAREAAPLRALLQQTQSELNLLKLSRPAAVVPPLVPLVVPPVIPLVESPDSRTISVVKSHEDDANGTDHSLKEGLPSVAMTQAEHALSAMATREIDVPKPTINQSLPSFMNRDDRPDSALPAEQDESHRHADSLRGQSVTTLSETVGAPVRALNSRDEIPSDRVFRPEASRDRDQTTPSWPGGETNVSQFDTSYTKEGLQERAESPSSFDMPQQGLSFTTEATLETTFSSTGDSPLSPFAHVNESVGSGPFSNTNDGIWPTLNSASESSVTEMAMTPHLGTESGLNTSPSPTGAAHVWKTDEGQDTPFVGGDTDFAVSPTTAVLEEPAAVAQQTLEEVTREFGVASSTEPTATDDASSGAKPAQLPAWWKDDDSGSNLLEELFSEQKPQDDGDKTDEADSGDPLALLRSQLAKVMEGSDSTTRERMDRDRIHVNSVWPQSTEPESPEGVEANSDSNESGDDLEQVAKVTQATSPFGAPETPETEPPESEPAPSSAALNEEPSAETAAPVPEEGDKSGDAENKDSEDTDSIEDQIARLLARSRGDSEPVAVAKPSGNASMKLPDPPKIAETFDVKDRSHLKAAPKHSLDKNAARKNLQSFRQVAKQSVKTALAKHKERRQFNMFLAKAMTFGICLTSTVLFLGGRLIGMNFSLVGGIASAALTVICALELVRAHFNIQKSRQKTAVEVENHSAASEQLAASLVHPLNPTEQKK